MRALTSEQDGFKAMVSEISDGNMSYIWGDEKEVSNNRQNLIQQTSVLENSVSVIQLEHGDKIKYISRSLGNSLDRQSAELVVADAISTDKKGLCLMLLVADCIPAVLYDSAKPALSIIHAGRKGVELNILAKTITWMKATYSSRTEDLVLITGPSIAQESYVFDSKDQIDTHFWDSFLEYGSDGKYHMDVLGMFKKQAQNSGLTDLQMRFSKIDTYADNNFFSHRRCLATGEPEARFALLAQLEKK